MNRYKSTNIASILGIIGNLFLLVIKGLISFVSHSQAMLADSINSASDIISSFLTFVGNKIASKPRDDDHHLGHGKAEYIYSMLISFLIILVAINVFKDAVMSFLELVSLIYQFGILLFV